MATELTIERAHLVLPHLVECAKRGVTITYGDLAEKIGVHHRAIPHCLYYIRDEICRPQGLPLLTAIVVHKGDQKPGESWLPEGTWRLTEEEQEHKFNEACREVFAYQGWDALLHELGLSPILEPEEQHRVPSADFEPNGPTDQEEPSSLPPTESDLPRTKLILVEYERVTALERVRLEFMEKVLQTYVTVASIVVAAVLVIAEKGDEMGVSTSVADALLVGLFAFGIITLYRTVNSNVALLELAKRLRALRRYFDRSDALRENFLVGLIDDPKRLESWAGWKSILRRGVSSGGSKGYLAIVVLLNSLCAGAISVSVSTRLFQVSLLSLVNLIVGVIIVGFVALLQVLYVSHRYEVAAAEIGSQSLEWFI
jgi:hypothetical protein